MAQGIIANAPSNIDSKKAELAGAKPGSVSANPMKNQSVAPTDAIRPTAAKPAIKRSTERPHGAGFDKRGVVWVTGGAIAVPAFTSR